MPKRRRRGGNPARVAVRAGERTDAEHAEPAAAPRRWQIALGIVAIAAALLLQSDPAWVPAVVLPGAVARAVLWDVALIAIGLVAAAFLVLLGCEAWGQAKPPVSSARIVIDALAVTGVTTLWALVVALPARAGTVPDDPLAFIGNTTVLGLLLGVVVVAAVWSVRAVVALARTLASVDRPERGKVLSVVVVAIVLLIGYPVLRVVTG